MPERPLEILLVEDSQQDVVITCQALARSHLKHRLWIARDGQEALDFLFRREPYDEPSRAPRPELVLLDLNLPKVNGFDVLRAVKTDQLLRRIPVVILSTSEREEDITACYLLGANTFIPKPLEFDKFQNIIRVVYEYWGQVARLPTLT